MNAAVASSAIQMAPEGSGIDNFAFWLPERRPAARNLAAHFMPPLAVYGPEMSVNGFSRPWCGANAWVPNSDDLSPCLHLAWESPQAIRDVQLTFDTDFDHPMESVLMTHPERVMPGCITSFRILTDEGDMLAEVSENHQTRWSLHLDHPVLAQGISIEILAYGSAPPAIFEVRCYS